MASITMTSTSSPPVPSAPSGGGGGGGGGGGSANGLNITNSASLYLYTFLATLVLLLSVSAAIVVRSFVLRRRHRLMVEEAIRNGTWVPPAPSARSPRVDLSKKPVLWEAYLGGGGWQVGGIKGLGQGSGKDLGIGTHWKFEHSRDWESIKPLCAEYVASDASFPHSASTPNLNPLPIPVPAPITPSSPTASIGDEENQQTPQVSSSAPSLFTRLRMFLNPTPSPTSPLPASSTSATNLNRSTNVSTTELRSSLPTTMRVAVLIAMPSPPPSLGSSTALSNSFSSSTSSSSNQKLSTSHHPLQTSPSQTLHTACDEEQPLPQLEMGVVKVVVGPSESSTGWDSARREKGKSSYSRGSSYAEP